MKVTKFSHSCILVEENNLRILIDPGIFSWREFESQLVNLTDIDYILYTHIHQDHLYIEGLKKLISISPAAEIIAGNEVVLELKKQNIAASSNNTAYIKLKMGKHAELWGDMPTPENTVITVFDRLTHVGDSHQFEKTAEILAVPIFAPWGSFREAMIQAISTKPQKVLPIHDWFLSDSGREWHYERAEATLKPHDIEFIRVRDGVEIEL